MKYILLATLFLPASLASGALTAPHECHLKLFNTHTQEHIDVVYRRDGVYDTEALAKLDTFLRDWRVDKVKHYDPRLFDVLTDLEAELNRPDAEINVICGYRTHETNEGLRHRIPHSTVAVKSLHIQAQAIDIRLPGVKTSQLRATALSMRRGGVGYYPGLDFVHVDVGPVRRWVN